MKYTLRIILPLCLLGGFLRADPVLSNVRASQRAGTRLVDIYYDAVSPNGPLSVTVEVSSDGGATYVVPAATFTGDIGAAIAPGTDRHIVWNAGVDRPGQLSPSMRFRVCVEDGLPPDSSFDPDALAYFNRSLQNGDPVTATARQQLDLFVRESKRLGFWNQMVYVPCRQGFGAMNTLGGAAKRTNAKFLRQGVTNLTNRGVEFVPGGNFQNRVQLPFDWPVPDEPLFVGVLGFAGSGPALAPYSAFLRWGGGATENLLFTYSSYDAYGVNLAGLGTVGANNGGFWVEDVLTATTRKPNFAGAAFDGPGHTLKSVLGARYAERTNGSVTTGRPVGPVYFLQPTGPSETHVVQGCVLFYGDVGTMPMGAFSSLVQSTLLSDTWGRYVYLHVGGQSNASWGIARYLALYDWAAEMAPMFDATRHSYGGQYISYWIGGDPQQPVRSTAYQSAKDAWLANRPLVVNSKWEAPYFWVQGESDTESKAAADIYLTNVTHLVQFLRQDLRNDLQLAIGEIDYAVAYRTAANAGNFEMNGCSQSGTLANGIWSITARVGLGNSFTDYDWINGNWHLSKDGGPSGNQWRVHAGGVTYYLGAGTEPHPCLVTSWSAINGAGGVPLIGESRTGNIEIVRKAQRDYVASDPNSFLVDTRGCERYLDADIGDGVHMTNVGIRSLATRFATAFTLARRP